MQPVPREAIADVRDESDFVELLRRELSWPIPERLERLDEVVIPLDLQQDFGFPAGEDRIRISRLFNLSEDQPWGIFLFEFKTKRPYLTHLRRLLRVLSSRRTLRAGDPIWNRSDLLFICTRDWKEYHFVHFAGEKPESAVISSFGWTGPEDPFLYTLCKHNLPQLRLPEADAAGAVDPEIWRSQWSDAFSIKPVTDEFYSTLKEVFDAVQAGVRGLKGENRRFFAELLVNRLIFLKFVEKKGWLAGDRDYLYNRFKQHGRKNYWRNFLFHFFFEGLNTEPGQRSANVEALLGDVPFLNAELFAKSDKWDDETVEVVNNVFDLLFDKLLNPYNFTVCETSPLDVEVAFNQDLLGYGYEELIADQHGQGAYYTHPTEVNLMCRESLRAYLEARCPDVDKETIGKLVYGELNADGSAIHLSHRDLLALYEALHDVTVVDPALGSGTFPVAMMKHLFLCLTTLGNILKGVAAFQTKIKSHELTDPADAFQLKLHIIEKSLYGCDIDYFAVQIAKLRFWIELMVNCDEPSALPNFDFKLVVGDALVSVVGTTPEGKPIALENILGHPTKGQNSLNKIYVDQYAELKKKYFAVKDSGECDELRARIEEAKEQLLINLGISIPKSRRTDKHVLWQIDFAEIFSGENPGFDISIANPPYLRHELIDRAKKTLLRSTYNALHPDLAVSERCDLYIYFFFRGADLLKKAGVLCYICATSWMDVVFGACLQKFVLQECEIKAIVDNCVKRSFASADVNTTINVFRKATRESAMQSTAKFVSFSRPYESLSMREIETALHCPDGSCGSQSWRRKVISQSYLYECSYMRKKDGGASKFENGNWAGLYLRAPTIFQDIVGNRVRMLCQLSELATVRFGLKSGANEFFYLTDELIESWAIEPKYIKPIIFSFREVKRVEGSLQVLKYHRLACHESKKDLAGTECLKYIVFGESQGFHNRPTCSSRRLWYSIGEGWQPAHFVFTAKVGERFLVYRNTEKIIEDKKLYGINLHKPIDQLLIAGLLNSTITRLIMEVTCRQLTGAQAIADVDVSVVENIWIPKPAALTSVDISKIKEAYQALVNRDICTHLIDEFKQEDRIALDTAIVKALGLSVDNVQRIYDAVWDIVGHRLEKADSV